jgi:hypothetical protein
MDTPTNPTHSTTETKRPHRRAWETPEIVRLPALTELTLLTGGGIPGGGDPGGTSTVF